jgi:folate-binding protein YgfZ
MRRDTLLRTVVAIGETNLEEYAGWLLPSTYGNAREEFNAANRSVALTDLSMSGRLKLSGADALDLLHRLSTNALKDLPVGGARGTLFLTEKGRIIDRAVVIRTDDSLLLITSPGSEQKVVKWIARFTITEDIQITDITHDTILFSIYSAKELSGLIAIEIPAVGMSTSTILRLDDCRGTHVRQQNMDSLLIMGPRSTGRALWEVLKKATLHAGGMMAGFEAYDTFRIVQGIPAGGRELSETLHPLEVNLREDISFTKGCYIGQEVVARMDTYQKVRRRLAGILLDEHPGVLPRPLYFAGAEIGILTSAGRVQIQGKIPGLAVVQTTIHEGQRVKFEEGGRERGALVSLPMSLS